MDVSVPPPYDSDEDLVIPEPHRRPKRRFRESSTSLQQQAQRATLRKLANARWFDLQVMEDVEPVNPTKLAMSFVGGKLELNELGPLEPEAKKPDPPVNPFLGVSPCRAANCSLCMLEVKKSAAIKADLKAEKVAAKAANKAKRTAEVAAKAAAAEAMSAAAAAVKIKQAVFQKQKMQNAPPIKPVVVKLVVVKPVVVKPVVVIPAPQQQLVRQQQQSTTQSAQLAQQQQPFFPTGYPTMMYVPADSYQASKMAGGGHNMPGQYLPPPGYGMYAQMPTQSMYAPYSFQGQNGFQGPNGPFVYASSAPSYGQPMYHNEFYPHASPGGVSHPHGPVYLVPSMPYGGGGQYAPMMTNFGPSNVVYNPRLT